MTETRPLDGLRVHPDAEHVPSPDPDTYDQMVEDVERRGIVVPLDIRDDGTVLDGRTRFSIARNLGIGSVPVRVVAPDDDYEYMLLAAIGRRHLSKDQIAALTLHLPSYAKAKAEAERRKGGRPSKEPTAPGAVGSSTGTAATVAGQATGVGARTVERAARVDRERPDLITEVAKGELSLKAAERQLPDPMAMTDGHRKRFPSLAHAETRAELTTSMYGMGKVERFDPADWQDRIGDLGPDDIDLIRSHVTHVRRWAEAWEALLDRPVTLRAIGENP